MLYFIIIDADRIARSPRKLDFKIDQLIEPRLAIMLFRFREVISS